jgi:hypothetical protein
MPLIATPEYKVRETISSPFPPHKVLGFTARNVKHGRDAILLKGSTSIKTEREVAEFPREYRELITEQGAELAVLLSDTVLVMQSDAFAEEHRLPTVNRKGISADMVDVSLQSGSFTEYQRDKVKLE